MSSAPKSLSVGSSLFKDGQTIPKSVANESVGGQSISPDLYWDAVPEGTRTIAIVMYDPDAPTGVGFSHWLLFNLDPSTRELGAGAGASGRNPKGSVLGFTDFGVSEYGGMAPPSGDKPHHYQFTVYALDLPAMEFGPTTTYAMFCFQIRGHVLAQGTLTGLFGV